MDTCGAAFDAGQPGAGAVVALGGAMNDGDTPVIAGGQVVGRLSARLGVVIADRRQVIADIEVGYRDGRNTGALDQDDDLFGIG